MVILLVATVVQFMSLSLKGDEWGLESILFGMTLLSTSVFLFITWKWGNRYPLLFGMLAILYLAIINVVEMGSISLSFEILDWPFVLGLLAFLAIPGFAIPVMATLAAAALNIFPTPGETKTVPWSPVIGRLILLLMVLESLLYTYRWLWLWDGIDDGIRWLIMAVVSGIAAISAGMMIVMTTSGWRQWTGLVFTIAVIGSIYLANFVLLGVGVGGVVTNYTATEARAARIQSSIENYHAENGRYPANLVDLVPGEIWRIPLPMIMPDQNWCYVAGPDHYRLGAVYREHWSSPHFSVRVYASAGEVPEETWECDEKLAEAKSQSGFYGPPPTPVALPTSITSFQKVVIEPLLQEGSISTGDWSPDGKYLALGLTEYFMDEVEHVTIDLRFLDAKTGEICQPDQSEWTVKQSNGLRDHSAWLPDGRFLYVTDAGEVIAFRPCAGGVEDLASRYPVRFTHVMSSGEQGKRVLLRNEDAYWLLDGSSLEVRKIAGIPTESYRPWYDWSPGGERLALSLMSGPEVEDEAFLYIVDWASAGVENILPLKGVSDAALPIVEWLTPDELLLHGEKLTVLDFRSDPLTMTDVLKDIFLLDIAPNEISSLDAVRTGGGYYLGAQIDHPRNQGGYVYASKTGQVEVFQQDVSTMIFFQDGQWMRLIKWEDEPSYRDEYLMVWMDRSNEKTILKIEGHVPRSHPQTFSRYLPASSQLVVSSSQGISLVSIPDGRTTGFWELAGNADYFDVIPSPQGEALIIAAGGDGLYYLPLSSK